MCPISSPTAASTSNALNGRERNAFHGHPGILMLHTECPYPRSAASFARSCVALIRRIVPERVRITSDSVVAPPALG